MADHRKKLGSVVLTAVVLLMTAQFGGIHTFIGTTYSIDDAAIVTTKEQPRASNAPLVGSNNMVLHPLLSRVWNPTDNNNKYKWCVPPRVGEEKLEKQERKNIKGLIYVKVPKTASSTSSGVTLQISRNIGRTKLGEGKSCSNSWEHGMMYRKRKPPYLLWTTLRDPSKRAISAFFHFEVSRKGVKPSSKGMINRLHASKNYQLNYISTQKIPSNATQHLLAVQEDPVKWIQRNVFDHYHFIAITERMQESLVVMKMLWGLSDADIIVMSAKRSGGYDGGRFNSTCVKIQPSFTTPEVDDFIRTNFTQDNLDYLLYAAANESLDLTIAALGRLRFEKELERHRGLQKVADNACLDKTDFPCSSTGTRQHKLSKRNCLKHDAGCGYQCVNELWRRRVSPFHSQRV
jgi:hypothetical protein